MKTIPDILPQLISDMELLKVEESLSPRLQWAKDNQVRSHHSPHLSDEEFKWCAWFPSNETWDGIPEDDEKCGYGNSEQEAHLNLADLHGFVNWRKLT